MPWRVAFADRLVVEMPFLKRMARRWCRQRHDIDDLVQDTLLRALANAHLWQAGSNLRGWLYAIMRNQFLAGIAKSIRAAEAHWLYATVTPRSVSHGSETRLVVRDLEGALGRLPRKQRAAVLLVGVEGNSYEQVAHATGASVDAIRSDLARARSRLRTEVYANDRRPALFVRPGSRLPQYRYALARTS
ncbi:MAG TPA: RNA polymerase sigma factor [Stellaceae bacterium]|nr:RNA polymerase sigma factor [Stellaceae bacterium]